MKNALNTIYQGLLNWADIIHEYRQSNASKFHYWK